MIGRVFFWGWLCACFQLSADPAQAQTLSVSPSKPDLEATLPAEARVLSLPPDAAASDVIATAKGDYGRLLAALYEQGYLAAQISITLANREVADLSSVQSGGRVTPINISILLGPEFRFGQAIAAPLPDRAQLPAGFAPGAVARTDVIREAAFAGIDAWRAASYAKAKVTGQSLTARHDSATLDAMITITPGHALRFGTLRVPSDTDVRPNRLRAIAGLPESAPFNPETLRIVRDRLVQTGAFDSIVITEADNPNPDGTLDVDLDVETSPPRRVGFGAQVEARDGLSLEAFWLHRNIFGGAERLRFDADVGGIGGGTGGADSALGGRLTIPGFQRADDTLEIFGTLEEIDDVTFASRFFEVGLRRERLLRARKVRVGAEVSFRLSETDDSFGDRRFRHVVFQIDGEQDFRDNALDTRAGRFDRLEVRPFVGVEEDSGTGARITGDARRYRLVSPQLVLAGRLQFGSVLGSSQTDTPPEFLFFSGGGGTVRGQSFQSLGVETNDGTVGGRGFLGANLEVRRDVTDVVGIVGFVDFGYVSEDGGFKDGESHSGVGLGLRYKTPVGPIRADIGFPLDGESEEDFGIFIGIGHAF